MFIQMRSIVVEKGNSEQVVQNFSKEGHIDGKEGLIDINIMVNRKSKESEEVVIMIRWESETAWKNWEKDPVHIAGHRNRKNEERPAYIIDSSVNMYDVKKIKQGTFSKETAV
ncbi:heme oxygenase (staphylobilin-producing) [Paenibacillus castaneae]|uniref:antibiotic biosynthesis monooxygenase n=1 Tax=Paenibacillus castaneae TaxID=474957 RepID=UPI000C9C11A6|nr:antibiotic biosynthesis monooxygenase [Paenibacillus castaneae]NIK76506.1 heme oxygenase (staphylobilin-producing) [Paenibacillus castaneae]